MPGEIDAARVSDDTTHLSPTAPGTGSPTVLIGGRPAWRTVLDTHICPATTPTPHGPEKVYLGSTTVLINDQMACRMGDILQGLGPPNLIFSGEPTVIIGDLGFGMANPKLKSSFATACRSLLMDWDTYTVPERLDRIQTALHAVLPAGMPPLLVEENFLLQARFFGQFCFQDWAIHINPSLLNGGMDEDRMARLVNTAYHEARHGEQWWTVAQHRAAQGESSQQIESRMQVPTDVADAAVNHSASQGTSEGAMGKTVYISVYGFRGVYRAGVLKRLNTTEGYTQYRALPEEEDAWRHGDDAEILFRVQMRAP